jgi:hypothetical protein
MRRVLFITNVVVLIAIALAAAARPAAAEDISGTILVTKVIFEDSRLTGDVTCAVVGAPCISFGAPHLTLKLNGFTMTGLANLQTPCPPQTPPGLGETGIDVTNQSDETILGPGVVQGFRQFGIRLRGATDSVVRQVTASSNCWSGFFVTSFGPPSPTTISHDNVVEEIVSVRNGHPVFSCGGI